MVGVIGGVCIAAAAETYAKSRVAGLPFANAIVEVRDNVLGDPLRTLALLAPFALLAGFAPVFALTGPRPWRWLVVALAVAGLTALYFNGFVGSEHAMRERKWTAAALSVGLIPVIMIPVILAASFVAIIVRALLGTTHATERSPNQDGRA